MTPANRYRTQFGNRSLELQLPDSTRTECSVGSPSSTPLRDLVRQALESPLEFPCVSAAILDEDAVAIAIEEGVPEAPAIVVEIVRWMLEQNFKPQQITVVLGSRDPALVAQVKLALAECSSEDPQRTVVRMVEHDPNLSERLEYIAAAKSADPIYIQRDLAEAAFVVPVYCIRHPDAPSASDQYAMSPMFADAKTQQRWHLAWMHDNVQHKHTQLRLSREAGWLMGIQFAMAVVPAIGGRVAQLIGGDPATVHQHALEAWQGASKVNLDQSPLYDLIIACVDGPQDQQTWMNVARAVWQADQRLQPAGRVVVCADLGRVTDGIAQLASDEPDEELQRHLLHSESQDAFAATILRSIQAKRSIYLCSNLNEGQIESLGFAFITDSSDIERLAQSAGRVGWLPASQF